MDLHMKLYRLCEQTGAGQALYSEDTETKLKIIIITTVWEWLVR